MSKPFPGLAWQSHRAAQRVAEGEARKVRAHVFGSPEPPFPTLQAARQWIWQQVPAEWDEQAATKQLDAYQAQAAKALWRAISPAPPWTRFALNFGFANVDLGPGNEYRATTETLRRLADAAARLASHIGWQEDEATRYILTGAIPRLQHRVSSSVWRSGVVRVHLTIFPWQLHPVEWSRLRREVERSLPGVARRALTPSAVHRQLLDLIAYLGPPPASKGQGRNAGRRKYWQRLAAGWGKTYRQKRSWNTIWKLYTRLPRQSREEIEQGVAEDARRMRKGEGT